MEEKGLFFRLSELLDTEEATIEQGELAELQAAGFDPEVEATDLEVAEPSDDLLRTVGFFGVQSAMADDEAEPEPEAVSTGVRKRYSVGPKGRSVQSPDWAHKDVLCTQVDPEIFFQENGDSKEAKKVCEKCEVRTECLEYALASGQEHGIWGGLSERERDMLRRKKGSRRAG